MQTEVHESTIKNLIDCREALLFALTAQTLPPDDIAVPLWETYHRLVAKIDEMKALSGYVETGWTVYAPKDD